MIKTTPTKKYNKYRSKNNNYSTMTMMSNIQCQGLIMMIIKYDEDDNDDDGDDDGDDDDDASE